MHGGFFVGEDGLELFGPGWFALAGVDEDALVAAADEVCVCSWSGSKSVYTARNKVPAKGMIYLVE